MKNLFHRRPAFLLLCLLLLPGRATWASQSRLWMASQNDFGAKTGFYLDFENATPDATPCPLKTLKLILAVGDGSRWRFLTTPPGQVWQYDRDYTVRATISPQNARLFLDGALVTEAPGDWKPQAGDFLANSMPSWAQDTADYLVLQKSLTVTNAGGPPLSLSFTRWAGLPLPLHLFEPQAPRRIAGWQSGPARTLTLTAVFRLAQRPADLHPLAPMVDRYGQAAAADWPGKIHSDADLRAAALQEQRVLHAWGPTPGLDQYGGSLKAGWHLPGTGFFRVARHAGAWWMISPQGHPLFYTGLDTAPALAWDKTPVTGREYLFADLPPKDGPTATAWAQNVWGADAGTDYLALHSVNMLHKYGPDWQQAERALTAQRLRAWGFSGLGKWADPMPGLPDLPVLSRAGVPTLAGHPDIFDPAIRTAFTAALAAQITPRKNDPRVVGWSVGNEYDEIITTEEIQKILALGADVPAKRALTDYLVDTLHGGDVAQAGTAAQVPAQTRAGLYAAKLQPPAAEVERLRLFYADRYYDFLYRTVKSLDPDHLYLGFWLSIGWWENEDDWRTISRHCDVVGYDRYAFSFADASFTGLIRQAGKPILCGEFSFPAQYDGARGFGAYPTWTQSDAESGADYTRWVRAAATDPDCVGTCWFQYRDEPLTGRGPGHGDALVLGEHYAFGLVDVTDRPKWDLVAAVRAANRRALTWRTRGPGH